MGASNRYPGQLFVKEGTPAMSGTPLYTPGQMHKLYTSVLSAFTPALTDLTDKYEPQHLLGVLEGRGQLLAESLKRHVSSAFDHLMMLEPMPPIMVPIFNHIDPTCAPTLHELEVPFDFVLPKRKQKGNDIVEHRLRVADLRTNGSDEEIKAWLGPAHTFAKEELQLLIPAMISNAVFMKRQGLRFNDGDTHLFYFDAGVICLYTDREKGGWKLNTYGTHPRSDIEWESGARVFYPAKK